MKFDLSFTTLDIAKKLSEYSETYRSQFLMDLIGAMQFSHRQWFSYTFTRFAEKCEQHVLEDAAYTFLNKLAQRFPKQAQTMVDNFKRHLDKTVGSK